MNLGVLLRFASSAVGFNVQGVSTSVCVSDHMQVVICDKRERLVPQMLSALLHQSVQMCALRDEPQQPPSYAHCTRSVLTCDRTVTHIFGTARSVICDQLSLPTCWLCQHFVGRKSPASSIVSGWGPNDRLPPMKLNGRFGTGSALPSLA
jgi:hypothetical protein